MNSWRKRSKQLPFAGAEPFDAVPVIADGVEAREDSAGRVQLRKLPPPARTLRARLAQRFGLTRPIRVDLDEQGSLFWKHVDGRRTLREIEAAMRQDLGRDKTEVEKAVIQFTRALLLRRLIHLRLPVKGGAA